MELGYRRFRMREFDKNDIYRSQCCYCNWTRLLWNLKKAKKKLELVLKLIYLICEKIRSLLKTIKLITIYSARDSFKKRR